MKSFLFRKTTREKFSRAIAIFSATALVAANSVVPAMAMPLPQQRAQAVAAKPIQVTPLRGQYCAGFATPNWFVYAENAQRVAFGADFSRRDGRAGASYAVFGGGALNHVPGSETPDRAVAKSITQGGRIPTQFLRHGQIGPNTYLVEFTNARSHGIIWYEVFPFNGNTSFVIVLRQANTSPADWPTLGVEATAVARSLRCHVPSMPSPPDPPATRKEAKKTASGDPSEEGDSLYNQWLGMEYYHDPDTGSNYWVSPTSDWSNNGPDGPGYYIHTGNVTKKLVSGYNQ